MSDLIDRQMAIDAVHKDYDVILDFESNGVTIAYSVEDILTALPPAQQWIPCSVRTPKKEEQSYWVCTDAGYQCQARWTDNIGFGSHGLWQWHFLDIPQYQKVVAWMKLPMSYHGGNNDDT